MSLCYNKAIIITGVIYLKKIALVVLIVVISSLFVSCSPKIPDGIEHKEFYKDMVSALKDLENKLKNTELINYESTSHKNVVKYLKEKMFEDNDRSDIESWLRKYIKDGLNEYEKDILVKMFNLLDLFNYYIEYQQENSVKVLKDKMIDLENPLSEDLRLQINKVLELLDLKYEIN